MNRIFDTFSTGVMRVLAWLLFVFFALLLGLIYVIVTPCVYISSRLRLFFGLDRHSFDQDNADEYFGVLDALQTGDLAFLELYAESVLQFPDCRDNFVERHWLVNAVDVGTLDAVAWVLDRCPIVDFYDAERRSPLTAAIQRETDSLDVVTLLLDRGADVNAKDNLEATPLHRAAGIGGEAVVKLLLDRGADPFACETDYVPNRPIDYAILNRHPNVVSLLSHAMKSLTKQ